MIDALMTGKLYAKPRAGTSGNGSAYVTARLLISVGEDRVSASCIAFDEDSRFALLAMDEGEALAIAGDLRPKVYETKDGSAKISLYCTVHSVLTPYHVKRKRQAVRPKGGRSVESGQEG